jgi:hypothetical protein
MGPSDISRHFDIVPTGFHLREYTVGEVGSLMRDAGFTRIEAWTTRKGLSVRLPWAIVDAVESTLERFPQTYARRVGRILPLRMVTGSYVIGVKQSPSS